jgi:hypothetical protein
MSVQSFVAAQIDNHSEVCCGSCRGELAVSIIRPQYLGKRN